MIDLQDPPNNVEEDELSSWSSDDQNNKIECLWRRGKARESRRSSRQITLSTTTSNNMKRNCSIQSFSSLLNMDIDLEKGYQEDTLQEQSNRLTKFLLSKTELATFDQQVPDEPKEITVVSSLAYGMLQLFLSLLP
jgi:hypothetical protein